MDLKTRIETTHAVNYNDLDKFIRHHTGQRDYECVPLQEWGNDSHHSFTVEPIKSDYNRRDWDAFKAGTHDGSYILGVILDGLCSEGKLAAGKYLVQAPTIGAST